MRLGGLAFIVWALTVAAATAEPLRYTLSPVMDNGRLTALAVELAFVGEPDGDTVIELPNAWGGKSELWRAISDFQVTGDGTSLSGAESARKVVRHAPNAPLVVRYRVSQYWPGEPRATGSNEYRPIVRPTYFHIIGHTAFARPAWSLATPAAFEFKNFPDGWRLASDLEHRGGLTPLILATVMESITVGGGDYRVATAGKLRIAMRGSWSFSESDFIKRLEPILASHQRFWGDPAEPYLVTLMPLLADPGSMSMGGTGLGDAFALFATGASQGDFNWLLAHEHLHTWIPRRIGAMPMQDDSRDYWLSEGFTDFYTARLMTRDGLWTLEESVKNINRTLWSYGFSPARNVPNARVARDFWTDRAAGEMPYLRGNLFAALADDRVRGASKGRRDLDDVVLAMKQEAGKAEFGIKPLARVLFAEKMRGLGIDIASDVERFIERGETIVLPENVFAPCGTVATEEIAVFDRGFDGRRTIAAGNVVTGVDPDGPAYRAGLRDGMRLRKLDLSEGGDSRRALVYLVIEGDKQREIRYLPEGKTRMLVQELRLGALDETGRKACAARLGGN